MYQEFAQVYDLLMESVDYKAWADHYLRLLAQAGIAPGAKITECACGTGGLTVHLARHHRMTGVDLSQEMLSIAADKLRAAGHQVPLIRQDMQQLQLHTRQDAILCTCDGVNYLTSPEALTRFLKAAHAALRPGGVLAFDVSTPYKLKHLLGNSSLSRLEDPVHYIWQNCWDEHAQQVAMRLHLYAREADGRYRLLVEDQLQQAWTRQQLEAALTHAGFSQIHAYGERTLRPPADTDQRMHLIALKPN